MVKICKECGHRKGLHIKYVSVEGLTCLQCLGNPPAKEGHLSECRCCMLECFFEERNSHRLKSGVSKGGKEDGRKR